MPFLIWIAKQVLKLDKKIESLENTMISDRTRIHERISSRPRAGDIAQLRTQIENVQHKQELQYLEIINMINLMYSDIKLLLEQQKSGQNGRTTSNS